MFSRKGNEGRNGWTRSTHCHEMALALDQWHAKSALQDTNLIEFHIFLLIKLLFIILYYQYRFIIICLKILLHLLLTF